LYKMVAVREHVRCKQELADSVESLVKTKHRLFLEATAHSSLAAVKVFRAQQFPDAEAMLEEYEGHLKYIEMEIHRLFKPRFFKENKRSFELVLRDVYNLALDEIDHPKSPYQSVKEAKDRLNRLIAETYQVPCLLPAGDQNELRKFDRVQIAYGDNLFQGYLVDEKTMAVRIDPVNTITPSVYPISEIYRVITIDDILFGVAKREEELMFDVEVGVVARQSFEGSYFHGDITHKPGDKVSLKGSRLIQQEVISEAKAPAYSKLRESHQIGDLDVLKRECHAVLQEAAMQEFTKRFFVPALEKLEDLYSKGIKAHHERVMNEVLYSQGVTSLVEKIAGLEKEIAFFEPWL